MKLYIAEKPSLGRAIADALPKPHRKGDGCIWVGEGDCVSWCIGHLLEQAEPDVYNPAFKLWSEDHLPIVPTEWKLQAKSSTRKQLSVLRKLVKQADALVHAGDPDREGQLLVDELINFLNVKGPKRQSIQRLLISDLNPSAVVRALGQMRDNRDFIPLSTSALARSRADWLYGINLTRSSTLQGRKVGYQGVLSVGRVQTPLLGLVVRRDEDIDNFVSKPFYEVFALLQTEGQPAQEFKAKWVPSDACQGQMDEEGRVLSQALANNVVARIEGQPASVIALETKTKRQSPPLPFSLSALQIEAGKRFGMSAMQVLDICQALYERHKLITYPRSDSRYLPLEQLSQASSVLAAIDCVSESLTAAVAGANTGLKSKAWNDSRVDAHHAIVPTLKKMDGQKLSAQEVKVYDLVARQYLYQFYPQHVYAETVVDVDIKGGCFRAKSIAVKEEGWKTLAYKLGTKPGTKPANKPNQGEPPQDSFLVSTLPSLSLGEALKCLRGECLEKNTQPPKAFTDATLLAAMAGIARFVDDAEVRKVLKETDGLGTEATRAGIIELLFKRQFLRRQGKQIQATEAGKGLINSLPKPTTLPDMTARWESLLDDMVERRASYGDFMEGLVPSLSALISESSATLPLALKGLQSPSFKSKGGKYKATKYKSAKQKKGAYSPPRKKSVSA